MKTLELNKMGLTPMNEFEMIEAEGGQLPYWLGPAGALIWWVADNWDDLKSGAQSALKEIRSTGKSH